MGFSRETLEKWKVVLDQNELEGRWSKMGKIICRDDTELQYGKELIENPIVVPFLCLVSKEFADYLMGE